MHSASSLVCVRCGRNYDLAAHRYVCDDCGLFGMLDVRYDYQRMKRQISRESLHGDSDFSQWRYRAALPVAYTGRETGSILSVGWTPLYSLPRLQSFTGLTGLFVKDDSRNPTGSLKDRATAVGVARARELGASALCAASTGNAASSLAGFAAWAGLPCFIFVPKTAPPAKVAQLLAFGARVFLVDGSYDEAFDLCIEAGSEYGWYNRSCAYNPYLVEGKKTVAYEVCEQLGWRAPDVVVMAVGDGCSLSAAWKGFKECKELGLTETVPVMIGVQAEHANPVSRAFREGCDEFTYDTPRTVADSISVGIPRNGLKALQAVRESGGFFLDVSDSEILSAVLTLARNSGVFAEPAGAASYAAVRRLVSTGSISSGKTVLTVVSGSGLKDIEGATRAVEPGWPIPASIDAVRKTMEVHKIVP